MDNVHTLYFHDRPVSLSLVNGVESSFSHPVISSLHDQAVQIILNYDKSAIHSKTNWYYVGRYGDYYCLDIHCYHPSRHLGYRFIFIDFEKIVQYSEKSFMGKVFDHRLLFILWFKRMMCYSSDYRVVFIVTNLTPIHYLLTDSSDLIEAFFHEVSYHYTPNLIFVGSDINYFRYIHFHFKSTIYREITLPFILIGGIGTNDDVSFFDEPGYFYRSPQKTYVKFSQVFPGNNLPYSMYFGIQNIIRTNSYLIINLSPDTSLHHCLVASDQIVNAIIMNSIKLLYIVQEGSASIDKMSLFRKKLLEHRQFIIDNNIIDKYLSKLDDNKLRIFLHKTNIVNSLIYNIDQYLANTC